MTVEFINIFTGETKTITRSSSDYFAPEWIEAVNREANALDGWRFAEKKFLNRYLGKFTSKKS